jgi:transcriptional regulator of arginine metabolism
MTAVSALQVYAWPADLCRQTPVADGRGKAQPILGARKAHGIAIDRGCMNMHNTHPFMRLLCSVLNDTQQHDRRGAIVRILQAGFVRKQEDLVRLLKKEGHEVTQSSVSRDLRDMGVLKASGRYVLPPDELTRATGDFGTLAQFVRGLKRAGPTLTVLKTTVGAAQSVAVAIDKAEWPEVAGTISGDDTIFIATVNSRAQDELLGRLQSIFRVA